MDNEAKLAGIRLGSLALILIGLCLTPFLIGVPLVIVGAIVYRETTKHIE
jgi:hypothetical protein